LLVTPAGDYVSSTFNRYGGALYKGKICNNSFLGEMSSAWNALGSYRSVKNFKISEISQIIASDTHPDSVRMREKVERYGQLLRNDDLEMKVTCADLKRGRVIIDGTHRAVSYYDYNVKKKNIHIELDVYIVRPAPLWVILGGFYRFFYRLRCRLLSMR